MKATIQSLGIDRLSVTDRMSLLEDLWDSIDAESASLPIPQWHRDELDRRLAQHRANPQVGSDWDEVKSRLFPNLGNTDDHTPRG